MSTINKICSWEITNYLDTFICLKAGPTPKTPLDLVLNKMGETENWWSSVLYQCSDKGRQFLTFQISIKEGRSWSCLSWFLPLVTEWLWSAGGNTIIYISADFSISGKKKEEANVKALEQIFLCWHQNQYNWSELMAIIFKTPGEVSKSWTVLKRWRWQRQMKVSIPT